MLFEYFVIGDDGKEQKGRIEASNKDEAKKKLNEMGLSILSVNEIKDQKSSDIKGLKTYQFSGKDIENQDVEGSIEAGNELEAYKRLIEEFGIDLEWIIDSNMNKVIQEAKKKTSIQELENLAYERGIEIKKKKKKSKIDSPEFSFDENFHQKQKKLQDNLKEIIKLITPFLPIIRDISPSFIVQIEKKLDDAQKIKMSNNLLLIEKYSDDVINDVLLFFDTHKDKKEKFRKELFELETYLSNAITSRIQKSFHDVFSYTRELLDNMLLKLNLKHIFEKTHIKEEHILIQLHLERKEIIKLLFFHLWGIIVKPGELKVKHKMAFVRLLEKHKKIKTLIRKTSEAVKHAKQFDKKDYIIIVEEVEFFSYWLLSIYIILFSISEISLIKSKILPIDFTWGIIRSELIVTIIFLLFLLVFISLIIKKYYTKNILVIFLSYLSVFVITGIFYFNY